MVDFSFSDEERMLRDSAREFVKRELLPLEPILTRRGIEGQSSEFTRDERKALQAKGKTIGFWGLSTPSEYGGAGLSPMARSLIYEELGQTFVGFTFGGSAMNIMYELDPEQQREYLLPTLSGERDGCFALSEPGVGSDARGIRTHAVRNGGDWILNGEKVWISGGNDADYCLVFARTRSEGYPDGVTAFLADRSMGWTSSPIRMMGAYDPASLIFQDVRVPNRNVIGTVNGGFQVAMRFIYENRAMVLPARNVGAAERLVGMALEHAENRVTFGKKIAERENIQWMIAESEVEIRAARLIQWNAAWQMAQGLDYRHAACAAKLYAAQMVNRVADRVVQIHGAMGYAKEFAVERWYRDVRVQRIYEGTDEIQLAWIFRNLRANSGAIGQLN